MTYPPPITDIELAILGALDTRTFHDPIEWSQLESKADLRPSEFMDAFANLVANRLIDSFDSRQGYLMSLLGRKAEVYVYITPDGQEYLNSKPEHGENGLGEKQHRHTGTPRKSVVGGRKASFDELLRLFGAGHLEVVRVLLTGGADPAVSGREDGEYPI